MPQLWTETFVSQYFWFMVILITLYYIIATKIIPIVANVIKIRQVTEITKAETEVITNEKTIELFNSNSKSENLINLIMPNWETIQNEWLTTMPENNNIYWVETAISEETKEELEIQEENDLTLEEFLKSE